MKFFLLIVICIPAHLSAQDVDSVKTRQDSLSITSLDTLITDTSGVIIKDSVTVTDTLYPLYQRAYTEKSFFINRSTIEKLDYRYTGDLFSGTGFGFLKDRGIIGQPNELVHYGSGYGSTGFFADGILHNNRRTGFMDLNFIQSELIDSIEILPLPRGFLYGADNFISSVNFIERDFITSAPYTRIKYYEGPDGEAFVDGMFNTSMFKKFNLTFDITNRKFDGTYTNSDFSIWQAKVKLKYFLSNKINFSGNYSLVSSEAGLNGGVDVDSISGITSDINSILYEPFDAPVVYPALRQEVKWDKFGLRMLGSFNNFYTDLNFYYHAEKEKYSGIPSNDELKDYINGASLRGTFTRSFFKLEMNTVYEKRMLKYYYIDSVSGFRNNKSEYSVYTLSPVFSLNLFGNTLVPSVFYKYTKYSHLAEPLNGFGADVAFAAADIINLYLGISRFDLNNSRETDVFEAGAKLEYKGVIADVRYFGRKNYIPASGIALLSLIQPDDALEYYGNLTGVSLRLNYDIWKIGIEGSMNFISFEKHNRSDVSGINSHFKGGVFYKNILFKDNLDIKTGFVLKYYDFESDNFESAYQVDFTVAGIVQEVAVVYFAWENILGEQYFIVPYYPMRERGIRFGLSWELFN